MPLKKRAAVWVKKPQLLPVRSVSPKFLLALESLSPTFECPEGDLHMARRRRRGLPPALVTTISPFPFPSLPAIAPHTTSTLSFSPRPILPEDKEERGGGRDRDSPAPFSFPFLINPMSYYATLRGAGGRGERGGEISCQVSYAPLSGGGGRGFATPQRHSSFGARSL